MVRVGAVRSRKPAPLDLVIGPANCGSALLTQAHGSISQVAPSATQKDWADLIESEQNWQN